MTQEHKFFVGILVLLALAGGGTWYVVNTQYQKQHAGAAQVASPAPSTEQKSEISQAAPGKSGSVYAVDNEKSTATWKSDGGTGTIKIASGKILEDKDGVLSGGMFAFNISSLADSQKDMKTESRLKISVFAVEQNPIVTLVMNKITSGSDATHALVTGDLMMRGVTHEVSFPVMVSKKDAALSLQADVSVDPVQWGVDAAAGKSLELVLDLVAQQEK